MTLIDKKILQIITELDVAIGLILGGIRKGKSVLGYGIIEDLHSMGFPAFVLGLPCCKHKFLPEHIKPVMDIDLIPDGSAFIVDEAYREFYARESMTKPNKFIDNLAGVSGQKKLKSIYITQQARRLERGIVGQVDFILFKKPSLMQMKYDRCELRQMLIEVATAFKTLSIPKGFTRKEYEKKCTYVFSEDFCGMVENSNKPPSWWTDELSRAYANVPLSERQEMTEKQIVKAITTYIGGAEQVVKDSRFYDREGSYVPKSKRTESQRTVS
jgi:hypothetical protein